MSTKFTNTTQVFKNNIIDVKNDIGDGLKIEAIYHHFMKMFDSHFLNYISFRKQRDLMITNIFYRMILEAIQIDKDIKQRYQLSDNFDINNKKLKINDEEILSISNKEIVLNLNQEIIILKTFKMFFKKMKEIYPKVNIQLIDRKIQKIIFLTDERMLTKLTSNIDIKNKIMAKIEDIISYKQATINSIFLNSLKKECEIFGIKI